MTQFCVEEAVFEQLAFAEAKAAAAVSLPLGEPAEDPLARARRFAAGEDV